MNGAEHLFLRAAPHGRHPAWWVALKLFWIAATVAITVICFFALVAWVGRWLEFRISVCVAAFTSVCILQGLYSSDLWQTPLELFWPHNGKATG